MRMLRFFSLLILSFLALNQIVIAQLGVYTFTGTSTGDNQFNTVTTQPANALFGAFSRTNVNWNAGANAYNSTAWTNATSIDLSEYIQFTITANPGYALNITSISFDQLKSASGPAVARIAHNNSGNFTTDYYNFSPTTTLSNVNWDITDFRSDTGATITFRIYGWTSTGGTFRVDNVTLQGTVQDLSRPAGGVFTWESVMNLVTNIINSPINGIYDIGNINEVDSFTSMKVVVTDLNSNLHLGDVPAILNGTDTIGNMHYNLGQWEFMGDGAYPTVIQGGQNDITATFIDSVTPPNSRTFTFRFTLFDGNPVGNLLTWQSAHTASHNILSPTSNIYDLGNIDQSDTLNSIIVAVTDTNLNKSTITSVLFDGVDIGDFAFFGNKWNLIFSAPLYCQIGQHNIVATFSDTVVPVPNTTSLTFHFTTIDTHSPVAGLFSWKSMQHTTATTIASPTVGVYNIGTLNETDSLTDVSLHIADYNLNTADVPVILNGGNTIGNMHYDGVKWNFVRNSIVPVYIPGSINNLTVTFSDTAAIPNTTTITISFTLYDGTPVPNKLTWTTSLTGNHSISLPTANIYNLGNIDQFDTINILTIKVSDAFRNTNIITNVLCDGIDIGDLVWDGTKRNLIFISNLYFPIGQHTITATFFDVAIPTPNTVTININFNIIDTTIPEGGLLSWSSLKHPGLNNITVPTTGVYDIGLINEIDSLTYLSIYVTDSNLNKNDVDAYFNGTLFGYFHYNGTKWELIRNSIVPSYTYSGINNIVAVFSDTAVIPNTTTLTVKFTMFDGNPVCGLLTWTSVLQPTLNTITIPTAGIYNLGNIDQTDTFSTINIHVIDTNLNKNIKDVFYNGTDIGDFVYNGTNWDIQIPTPIYFPIGQHDLLVTFADSVQPTPNSTPIIIRFTTIDTHAPVGGLLTWTSIQNPAPPSISIPTLGIYDLGNIDQTDTITSINVVVSDANLDTNLITNLMYNGTDIGDFVYNGTSWDILIPTPIYFPIGQHDITATFADTAQPTANTAALTFRFTTIDTHAPVGGTLTWTSVQNPAPPSISMPTLGIYDLGNIDQTDTITSINVIVTDANLSTSTIANVFYNGTDIGDFVYNGTSWDILIPTPIYFPIGQQDIIATFSDAAQPTANTTTLTFRATIIDTHVPIADSLTWTSIQNPAPPTILLPTSGVYNLGNIDQTDTITTITIHVTDANLNTNVITNVIYNGTDIGDFVYNGTNWDIQIPTPVYFPIGQNDITVAFVDSAQPTPNSTPIIIRFTTIDTHSPVGGLLTWTSVQNPAPPSISMPTLGIYDLGNIDQTDTITSINVVVSDANLDTNLITNLMYNGTDIGDFVYNGTSWDILIPTPIYFPIGQHDITATFADTAQPTANTAALTFRFTTIDTHVPVGGTLTWTSVQNPAPPSISMPTLGIYDLGNIDQTDTITSLNVIVTDANLSTSTIANVFYNGTDIGDFVYNGTSWDILIPTPIYFPIGQQDIIATFSDTAQPTANTTTLTFRATIIDTHVPIADSLTWTSIQNPAPPTILLPTSGVYNLGNIDQTDTITTITIHVTDANLNTNVITNVIYNGTDIGDFVYNGTNWDIQIPTPVYFPIGQNDITVAFADSAQPTPNSTPIIIRFTTIDTHSPVGGLLTWTSIQNSAPPSISNPTLGIYDLGNIDQTDTITSINVIVTDANLNTNTITNVLYNGTDIGDFVYNGTSWDILIPTLIYFPIGQHDITATFADTAQPTANTTALTFRFTTIDTHSPVAGTLTWTSVQQPSLHTISIPAGGIYNLGNLDQTDTITSLNIIVNDANLDTNIIANVIHNSNDIADFVYDGTKWNFVQPIPVFYPLGQNNISVTFADTAIPTVNTTLINISFNIFDGVAPVGDSITWTTAETGYHTLYSPTATVYNLGNICHSDQLTSLVTTIHENNPNTNNIPVIHNIDTLGYMVYSGNSLWNLVITNFNVVFNQGVNNLTAKYNDIASNSLTLTYRFYSMNNPIVDLGSDSIICSYDSISIDAGIGMDNYFWLPDSTTNSTFIANVSKLGIGTSSIYVTVTSNGCSATDSVHITLLQQPNINAFVLPTNSTICYGDSALLFAVGADSYTWKDGNILINTGDSIIVYPNSTTTYTVVGTSLSGCYSTQSLIVNVDDLPNINLGSDWTLKTNEDLELSAPSGSNYIYLWSDGQTGRTLHLYGDTLGIGVFTYWVSVSDVNTGCYNVDSITITVIPSNGIDNNNNSSLISIYPNPSSGLINLESADINSELISIDIFNITGQKVYQNTFENNMSKIIKQIDLSEQPKGVYLVKIIIGNTVKTEKLIIE